LKIVREYINEKFTEDSDPIHDMSIGVLTRYPISVKQYRSMNFDNLLNHPYFRKFLMNIYNSKNFKVITNFSKNHKRFLLEKYGKQDFVWTYQYKEYAWAFKLPSSSILIVFSGNKGTSYEYSGTLSDIDIKFIERFIENIVNQ
jgi:hypothetical protein